MKLHPIEGPCPGIWKLHQIPLIPDMFTMHGKHDGKHDGGHVRFLIYNNKGSGCKKKNLYQLSQKSSVKKSVGYVIKSNG